MNAKKIDNEYKSFAEWRTKLFPKFERDSELNELKKNSGQLGIKLADESIERALKENEPH